MLNAFHSFKILSKHKFICLCDWLNQEIAHDIVNITQPCDRLNQEIARHDIVNITRALNLCFESILNEQKAFNILRDSLVMDHHLSSRSPLEHCRGCF